MASEKLDPPLGDPEKANEKNPSVGSVQAATILEHSHDADEALRAFEGQQGKIEIDEATNKRLLRLIDRHMLWVLCICYGLNYLDKVTISYASVMGIETDINLVGDDYQWLSSMFYFGYLGWEYPTNRLLQRLPLAKYSAACIILWGGTLACFAAVKNFGGGVAVRFFLGVCESAVTPGFALFTSQWYTKSEQASRLGIWFCMNGVAQIFGGLVAYGIAKGTDQHQTSIAGWKILFLVTGCLTMVMGIIFLFVMPDNQLNAWWLKKEDRVLAVERVRVNQQGIGNKHFKWYQFKEALTDPMTWAFFFYALVADIPNGGISNFFSLLIKSFGYSDEQSLLYGTPGGAVEVITLLISGFVGAKFNIRILFNIWGLALATLGMIMIIAVPAAHARARLTGYYFTQASATGFVALLSLIATNVAGYTKKTTVAALYLIAYCTGNIIGPQTFRPKDAPEYTPAKITIIVCWVLCMADLVFIWWYCKYQNAKKEAVRSAPGYSKLENQEWLDLTDRENPEFIYAL